MVYDAGALIAAERSGAAVWSIHRRALLRGLVPLVPAPVLAQVWRGGPQALLSRFLAGCEIEPMNEMISRRVGVLAARTGHADVVDLAVIEAAQRLGLTVVTSDRPDVAAIASSLRRPVPVVTV